MRILILSQKLETLSQLFEGQPPYEYRLCTTIDQLTLASNAFKPQLVVLGEDLQTEDTAALLSEIRKKIAPRSHLICITRQRDLPELCACLIADALLHPNDGPEQIQTLLTVLREQKPYISPLLLPPSPSPIYLKSLLSTREKQILDLMTSEWPTRTISDHLHISKATVKNHRKSIKNKLGLTGGKATLTQFIKLCEITQLHTT